MVSEVSNKCNQRYLGTSQEILVEGKSGRSERLTGRTRTNKIVNFEGPDVLIGQLVNVSITAANPWALRGALKIEAELCH